KERQYRFFAERLNPIPLFPYLAPPPPVPGFESGPRRYTPWLAVAGEDAPAPPVALEGDGQPLAGADHF
ncbi:MAG: hypothetical protein KDE29_22995, partial [Anaerolineales bacterium]|nr:hypothetical protein [Anaerolineales bacterium]